ncbi:MAG: hypothetical protein SGARI_005483, partial [Bacillariaceae sp.]
MVFDRLSSLGFLWMAIIFGFPAATSLPLGFIAEVVTSKNAITGTFAPNPRNNQQPMLMLVHKSGVVSVLENPDDSPDTIDILDIGDQMCTDTERGLQSLAIHPQFGVDNHSVYLYYTKFKRGCLADDSENGPWNVVERVEMDPVTLLLNFGAGQEIW